MSNIAIYAILLGIFGYAHAQTNLDNKPLIIKKIISVYDGDTFRASLHNCGRSLLCENLRIRLANIDTPEIRTADEEERKAAKIARDKLYEIMSTAYLLELKDCQRGKYFRLICDVRADGLSISDLLIDEGLGVPYE